VQYIHFSNKKTSKIGGFKMGTIGFSHRLHRSAYGRFPLGEPMTLPPSGGMLQNHIINNTFNVIVIGALFIYAK
jgi:hypothetical protein